MESITRDAGTVSRAGVSLAHTVDDVAADVRICAYASAAALVVVAVAALALVFLVAEVLDHG